MEEPKRPFDSRAPPGVSPFALDSETETSSASSASDSEAVVKKASQMTHAALFETYARKLGHKPKPHLMRSLRNRGKKGPHLVAGLVDYVHSLEARISSLEARRKTDKPESDKEEDDSSELSDLQSELRDDALRKPALGLRIEFYHVEKELDATGRFRPERDHMFGTYRSHVGSPPFIRVAYRWRSEKPAETLRTTSHGEMLDPADVEVVGLRIYSDIVTNVLRRSLAGIQFVELFKPFRVIIRNLAEIRAALAKVESEYGFADVNESGSRTEDPRLEKQADVIEDVGMTSGSGKSVNQHNELLDASSTSNKGPEEPSEELTHLREFIRFVDKYLEPQIQLYETIREGSVRMIAFENLWMLFNFNETIYCPVKRGYQELTFYEPGGKTFKYQSKPSLTPQAYRVVYSGGGVGIYVNPSLDYIAPESQGQVLTASTKERFCRLIVGCFSVGFDGEKYTPVQDYFIFKPFEGEVAITSLEAYPLRFHRQEDQISNMLLERGSQVY
ncbi:hypothetical protein GGR52DRAFT_570672 [Hypoxylon sp. FL1284]|nr:hypothetical protein GGR52DRAFT_570672 [Hypoxylon sp. FL1284]